MTAKTLHSSSGHDTVSMDLLFTPCQMDQGPQVDKSLHALDIIGHEESDPCGRVLSACCVA